MPKPIVAYLAAAATLLVLDFLWLGVVARGLYKQEIGHLMADQVVIPAALIFYALYPVGLLVFVVMPSMDAESLLRPALLGLFFGLVAYATYDLSNLATLRGFSVKIALVDMAWGSFASAVAVVAGVLAGRSFGQA